MSVRSVISREYYCGVYEQLICLRVIFLRADEQIRFHIAHTAAFRVQLFAWRQAGSA